ncbi:MauE/DoxX family redox-associated membrane protein [Limnohabitans sp.]|jgi:hypothetical protein|uniref:MauE/DoxX family redox-associated membrane protein n=1 Tax=Limnohabitans sp. TaxID=1907725 RepID=UPI0037BE9A6D
MTPLNPEALTALHPFLTGWELSPLEPLLVWIPTAWLALLWAHAGVSQLLDRQLFLQHLAAYRVPWVWLTPMSWALPLLSLAVALSLVSPLRPLGAAGAAALLLSYAGAMAWHLARGHRLDCGCGGEPLRVSAALVLRNLGLVLLAGLSALPVQDRALTPMDGAVLVLALLVGGVLWLVFHQLLRSQRPDLVSHASRH